MPEINIKDFNASEFLAYMNKVDFIYDNAGLIMDKFNPDEVLSMLEGTVHNSEKSWKFQSDILKNVHDRSKFGQKAVENISKKVGISRAYAFDLLKINEKIFSQNPSTRNLPNLSISHYFTVVRAWNKINNPIELLFKASDEEWSTTDMRDYIKSNGAEVIKTITTEYFKIEKVEDFDQSKKSWESSKRLAGGVYIMTDTTGDQYLEVKTITK